MLQGLLHDDTDADVIDTHGASIVAFGFCELLAFIQAHAAAQADRQDPALPPRPCRPTRHGARSPR